MGEESINRDSISDSSCSRSSADALIAKSPPEKSKGLEFSKRNRKHSKKLVYDFLDKGTEAQKDSFKWIPNPSETACQERRSSLLKEIDSVNLTLNSARTPSYTSDFTSNTYCKNGYIRGCSDKNCKNVDSPLKYNEFSSLMSTLGTGSEFPMEVKVAEKEVTKPHGEGRPRLKDENATYVITGSVQLMLGILMAVFGVLVIAYGSSLSGVGSGLWGGAVAMFSGKHFSRILKPDLREIIPTKSPNCSFRNYISFSVVRALMHLVQYSRPKRVSIYRFAAVIQLFDVPKKNPTSLNQYWRNLHEPLTTQN